MRPSKRPNCASVGGLRSLIWSARAFAATFSLVNTTAEKSSSSQLRAISSTARERVLPAPNTPAMHKSDRPVRMANSSATVTVRTWPSPCPAKARRLSRRYRSCKPSKVTVAGVRNRRSMRTKASLSFVCARWPCAWQVSLAGGFPWSTGVAMDWLVQRLAIHGGSECHQERRVVLRRWERWHSAQSASANQCQD